MISKNESFTAFRSPVPTIRTPYKQNGEIDYDGLRNCVEFDIQAGARAIVITAGDSHLIAMSDREIADVAKAVVKQADKRALVVAADRNFDTKQALEFAGCVKEMGCDMLMLMPPDWVGSSTPDTLSDHYAAVAKIIPVMIVTNVFIPRGAQFGMETIKLALRKSADILAVKDDMCGDFARQLAFTFSDQVAVWAGGQKQNHMNMAPYGACGYLSTFLTFKPEIARKYWEPASSGNLAQAAEIISRYDLPFFDAIAKSRGGFDAGMHGVLELFGLCQRWRPKPYYNITNEELIVLADELKKLKIL